jgi:protein-S-isoprenylcysteine O-methyltransferase Ste14
LNGQESAGEHPLTDIGQRVLFAVFLAVWITDSFFFRYSVFSAVLAPGFLRFPVGAAILAASVLLTLKAHKAVFNESGREPDLISEGVFSLVRHPMYLGSWLFSFGLVLMTFSVSSSAVSLIILLFYYLIARYEEQLLVSKFGDRYRIYQVCVPMLFPFTGFRTARGRGARPNPLER